ncbi:MAG: hypothetical protein ACK5LK_05585, partial [Chthoniobacterales bacterium]
APAPLKVDAKKETAKVPSTPPPGKNVPQATVQLKKPDPAKSASASAIRVQSVSEAPAAPASASGDGGNPILAIAACVTALIALGIQFWMLLG